MSTDTHTRRPHRPRRIASALLGALLALATLDLRTVAPPAAAVDEAARLAPAVQAPQARDRTGGETQQRTWQTVDLEGATCGGPDRSPYQYFLNPPQAAPEGILFVLAGGGACMKSGPAPAGATGVAAQLHCMDYGNFRDPYFNALTFASDLAPAMAIPFFRRTDDNPFRDYVFVAVPYCTGDVHAGSMTEPFDYDPEPENTFEVLHRGHLNVEAVVVDVHSRYPTDLPVILSGFSAGGFGAIYNFETVVARYPRTTVVSDAGIAPGVPGSTMEMEAERLAERWSALELLPSYCRDRSCIANTLHLLAAHARAHNGRGERPWRPFGLLQGQQDSTLSAYLEVSSCAYQLALASGLAEALANDNLRAFVPATAKHVFGAVNPLETPFRSQSGVDPIAWAAELGAAEAPDDLPPNALDPWMACNAVLLPLGHAPAP